MKKTTRVSGFILVAVLCLSVFIGLTRNNTVTNANALGNSDISVGVSLALIDDADMADIKNYIQSLYQNSNVTVTVEDAKDDSNLQKTQLDVFIVQRVDAIVVKPVDEDALVTTLDNAADQGISVIVIGQNNNKYKSAIYVDFDYTKEDESDVEDFIENYWDQSGNYTVLLFACNSAHGNAYYQSRMAILSNYPNITVDDYRVDKPSEVSAILDAWLLSHNNILPDAIFNCCFLGAHKAEITLIKRGYTYGPDGMPLYGVSDYTENCRKMINFISDLIQKITDGEINPTNGQTYLVDTSSD